MFFPPLFLAWQYFFIAFLNALGYGFALAPFIAALLYLNYRLAKRLDDALWEL